MKKRTFSHQLDIDQDEIVIYRVFSDGEKQLYTKLKLPSKSFHEDRTHFDNFAKNLGEALLIDSPVARKKFKFT